MRRFSLARRLLMVAIGASLALLAASGGLAWLLMRNALHRSLDDALRSQAQALAARVESDAGRLEFEPAARELDPEPGAGFLILDDSGGGLFNSLALDAETIVALQLRATRAPGEGSTTRAVGVDAPGRRMLALQTSVRPDDELSAQSRPGRIWVIVSRSTAPLEAALASLATALVLAAGVVALLLLLSAPPIARVLTRPLRDMATRLAQVDPAQPRLDPAAIVAPREFEPIVETTQRLLDRVRDELDRQRRLTTDVAHDLRTPVAGVRALLDVSRQRERSAAEMVDTIDKARDALRELSRLLDDVLALSRIDASIDQPRPAPVSILDAFRAVAATVRPLADAREVRLALEHEPQAELFTDRGMLVKVLDNLVANAVEHSPRGAVVHLSARDAGPAIEFAVRDRGAGVPEVLRERIFQRFIRGDADARARNGHHGLGLPIALGLARALGGTLKFEAPTDGPGSRFVLRLPRDDLRPSNSA